ncbi:hypothetical protein NE635_22415, partial [Phocaeicola vulgatus]|nr:hypothetical protein [Phocaeicola vulgatus]MCQ5319247.1 hypothetical protein [Phocaeicola vulgatus]MCQ5331356.1 hypothetical protein [Phocaeicola vulgatus]
CLSTIVFILPLHLDYTKVIILILWWRNFQLEYWRTFQLVSTAVISGALYEIYHKQKKSLTDQLILRPFPQGDDAKEMWEIYRQDMISYSGISIFLLGNKKEGETTVLSNGMRSEYEISKKQGNFLIPIGRTGYISEVLWNELLKEKQDDHTFDIYRHDIVSLGDNTKALDEVIEIVIELIKKVK